MTEFKFFNSQPQPVGYWILPGSATGWITKISVIKMPNKFHIFMMKVLLGWSFERIENDF